MSKMFMKIRSLVFGLKCFRHDISCLRHYPAPRKRFYKNVFVSESNGGYEINLDKRKLKTPLGKLLKLPNEALASAVAAEWEMQGEHLELHNMYLTNLSNTAIDNPANVTKEAVVDSTLEYLNMDTLCYRNQDPPELGTLQMNRWNPVVEWFENQFQVKIHISDYVVSAPIPKETLAVIERHLLTFNSWSLTGISYAAENLKSLMLTLAIIHQKLEVEPAVELSRLEMLFQTGKWGSVDWSHEIELTQTTAGVAAATLFVYLNEESTHFVKKTATTME